MAQWVKVSSTEDFSDSIKVVVYEGARIALYKVGEGEFYATDDHCSHAEVSLAGGELSDYEIKCPRHGARFDIRTGKNLCFPAVTPVKSYPVKVEGTEIFLDLEE